jgi:uncharacterized protein (TIGR02996 family)
MDLEAAFVEAIVTAPGDPTPRLIFADWLEEQDDPRGEYIRLGHLLDTLPGDDPRRARALRRRRAMLSAHPVPLAAWDRVMSIARIRVKLESLRQADPGFTVYGVGRHQYRLNACLTEPELAAFEGRIGTPLPAEYRMFLKTMGNGGAGPDNGLHPLHLDRDVSAWRLDEPFPISTRRARAIMARQKKDPYRYRPRIDYPLPGCMELSDAGCGTVSFLVVSGEQAGVIWYVGDLLAPLPDRDGGQAGFLAWYEGWLDDWLAPGRIAGWRKSIGRG